MTGVRPHAAWIERARALDSGNRAVVRVSLSAVAPGVRPQTECDASAGPQGEGELGDAVHGAVVLSYLATRADRYGFGAYLIYSTAVCRVLCQGKLEAKRALARASRRPILEHSCWSIPRAGFSRTAAQAHRHGLS